MADLVHCYNHRKQKSSYTSSYFIGIFFGIFLFFVYFPITSSYFWHVKTGNKSSAQLVINLN